MGEGEQDNLEMDMFDSNIELNFDYVPEEDVIDMTIPQPPEIEDDTPEEGGGVTLQEGEEPDDMPDILKEGKEKEITPSEGAEAPEGEEAPESVAGDEAAEVEGDDQSSPNLYSSLATVLHEQGLLPSLTADKKIDTIDDLVDSFKTEMEANKFVGLNDLQKEALTAFENGISVEEFRAQKETELTLDGISEDVIKADVDLAEQIIRQDLINQGVDERTVSKLVARTKELGNEQLIEDALESIDNVKQFQKDAFTAKQNQLAQEKIDAAKAIEAQNAKFKDEIYNKTEIIKGNPLSETIKNSVYKTMSEVVGRDPNGKPENKFMRDRRENPIEFDTNLYYVYELTKGFKDFSGILGTGKTAAVRQLESVIRTNPFIADENQPSFTQDADSYDSPFGDELNI